MGDALDADAYDALVTAAETYRAAVVIRLAGEAGLRTGEIPRVAPRHLREPETTARSTLLSVPAANGEPDADGETVDRETLDRETVVPASLAAELRRYAETAGLDKSESFVDVSPRRVQMIVNETADRAAALSNGEVADDVTPSDLRHTFARRLLVDRGVDPHVVREAGGWETMGALDGYLGPLDGAAIADAIDAGTRAEANSVSEDARSSTDGVGDDAGPRSVDDADPHPTDAEPPIGGRDPSTLAGFEAVVDAEEDETPLAGVPEGVVAADRWVEAWVLRGTVDGGRVEVAGAAGVDRETLADRGVTSGGPWCDAIDADGPVVIDEPVAIDEGSETGDQSVKDDLSVKDDRHALAVPVRYRDVTHGTLCVVAEGGSPISSVERRELAALGKCLGWAVTAGRWRDLLHSDAVTEVEFHTADDDAFLAQSSAALGCRIELASTVAVTEDASRLYLSVTGAMPQEFADVVDGTSGVSDLRVRETREDGCSVSVRVEGGSAVRTLTEHGATVRDAAAEDGRLRVVADLPEGADVRPVADGLRASFPDARLASKESVARTSHAESSFRTGVADRFTDRQWAALSAAYHGGYFDWPRGSTAEEVADAMDVSSPTFHNHLRKAQRALLDGLFEGDRHERP
ncbi:bacterio-opsin activator domain-containing protein [Halorubrum trueperi]|uniref:Bacterio-opsin activator domain-containing protein n=1 Tax=Halorubrum trueperi TaxID=2004704 RepID=A0ABD5UMZ0_9EURY